MKAETHKEAAAQNEEITEQAKKQLPHLTVKCKETILKSRHLRTWDENKNTIREFQLHQ